jgi:hypothetical protein
MSEIQQQQKKSFLPALIVKNYAYKNRDDQQNFISRLSIGIIRFIWNQCNFHSPSDSYNMITQICSKNYRTMRLIH